MSTARMLWLLLCVAAVYAWADSLTFLLYTGRVGADSPAVVQYGIAVLFATLALWVATTLAKLRYRVIELERRGGQ